MTKCNSINVKLEKQFYFLPKTGGASFLEGASIRINTVCGVFVLSPGIYIWIRIVSDNNLVPFALVTQDV